MIQIFAGARRRHLNRAAQAGCTRGNSTILHEVFPVDHGGSNSPLDNSRTKRINFERASISEANVSRVGELPQCWGAQSKPTANVSSMMLPLCTFRQVDSDLAYRCRRKLHGEQVPRYGHPEIRGLHRVRLRESIVRVDFG